jgi:hypothetical protein
MTERKPHPDNALIDEMEDQGRAPSQVGSSGGNVQTTVGARAESHGVDEDPGVERARSLDNPVDAEMKGKKSIERLDPAKKGPKGR